MTEEIIKEEQENIPYAQINEDGICFAVSSLSGVVEDLHLIRLETYDESLLGKKYEDGSWQEILQPEMQAQELSDTERAIFETQANTEYIACLLEGGN